MATNTDTEQDELRAKAAEAVRRHKASWIELGQYLYTIQKNRMFRYWGYLAFDAYCAKELGIKPMTAFKMVRSYMYLEREEPKVIESHSAGDKNPRAIPSFESVNVLRLAKRNKLLTPKDMEHIREEVLEAGKEPKEIRAHLKRMLSEREVKGSAEVRKMRRNTAIKRLMTILANTKKEFESNRFLPDFLLNQIADLEKKLEDQIE